MYSHINLVNNWSYTRKSEGKFEPEDIDPNLCTHIIYGYAALHPQKLTIHRSNFDVDTFHNLYERITAFRKQGIKVIIAMGGLTTSVGEKYHHLLTDKDPETIWKFIYSVIAFMDFNEFDGFDIEVSGDAF